LTILSACCSKKAKNFVSLGTSEKLGIDNEPPEDIICVIVDEHYPIVKQPVKMAYDDILHFSFTTKLLRLVQVANR
jgi:hypothetical protein